MWLDLLNVSGFSFLFQICSVLYLTNVFFCSLTCSYHQFAFPLDIQHFSWHHSTCRSLLAVKLSQTLHLFSSTLPFRCNIKHFYLLVLKKGNQLEILILFLSSHMLPDPSICRSSCLYSILTFIDTSKFWNFQPNSTSLHMNCSNSRRQIISIFSKTVRHGQLLWPSSETVILHQNKTAIKGYHYLFLVLTLTPLVPYCYPQ